MAWRHATLPLVRSRARELGQRGAAFPWRTINGVECSDYWPAGTASFHVYAAIADACVRYVAATGDADFDRSCAVELLAEMARLWASLGHFAGAGNFRIHGVIGPDEYTAIVDDNAYTNLMAQRTTHVEPFDFDRLYGNFETVIESKARDVVRRSADRHIGWVRGDFDHLT